MQHVRQFLLISGESALAFDAKGWIVERRGTNSKTACKWEIVAHGIQTRAALIAALQTLKIRATGDVADMIDDLPATFEAWLAARRSREAERAGYAA